jgi:transcriptional regulator with XRE-family HTH domain
VLLELEWQLLSRTGDESLSIATTKKDLLNSLKDREFRAAWNLENVYTTICFQLRALREQRDMSQGTFGQQVKPKMAQERISILEDPNAESKPTLNTLLRLADAADVGLDVRFVPFSTVLLRSVHTDMRGLEVDSFTDELPLLESEITFETALETVEASAPVNHSTRNLTATLFAFPRNPLTATATATAAASANRPTPVSREPIAAAQVVGL